MVDPEGTQRVLAATVFAGVMSMVWGLVAVLTGSLDGSTGLLHAGHSSFSLGMQTAMIALLAEAVLFPWR